MQGIVFPSFYLHLQWSIYVLQSAIPSDRLSLIMFIFLSEGYFQVRLEASKKKEAQDPSGTQDHAVRWLLFAFHNLSVSQFVIVGAYWISLVGTKSSLFCLSLCLRQEPTKMEMNACFSTGPFEHVLSARMTEKWLFAQYKNAHFAISFVIRLISAYVEPRTDLRGLASNNTCTKPSILIA